MTDLQKEQLSDWYKTSKVGVKKIFEMSSAAQIIDISVIELFAYQFEIDKKEINELFIAI